MQKHDFGCFGLTEKPSMQVRCIPSYVTTTNRHFAFRKTNAGIETTSVAKAHGLEVTLNAYFVAARVRRYADRETSVRTYQSKLSGDGQQINDFRISAYEDSCGCSSNRRLDMVPARNLDG